MVKRPQGTKLNLKSGGENTLFCWVIYRVLSAILLKIQSYKIDFQSVDLSSKTNQILNRTSLNFSILPEI